MNLPELPALRVASLIGAGISVARLTEIHDWLLLITVFSTLLLLFWHFLSAAFKKRTTVHQDKRRKNSQQSTQWSWLIALFLTGVSVMALHQTERRELEKRHEWVDWVFGEDVWIQGKILFKRESIGDSLSQILEVRIDSIGFEEVTEVPSQAMMTYPTAGRFSLERREKLHAQTEDKRLQTGQQIRAKIRLYPAQDNLNPGSFRFATWLQQKGLYLQGVVLSHTIISDERPLIDRIREGILNQIEQIFSPETAPFLKAFILGDKTSLESSQKETFSRAGLSHIMAVSGLHVGFMLTPFWFFMPYFRRYRIGAFSGVVLLIGFLVLYASLTGFSTSVNRAALMAIFLGFGSLYQKVRNPINQMFVAATVILLIRPDELFQPGFQLSFGAVTLLLLWMPTVQQAIETRIKNRALKATLMVMSVTIVVQTGLTPILAYWFGELSLVAPLSNLFVVPLLSFLMPMTLVLLAGAPLFEHIPWVFELSNTIVKWILLVSDHAGKENLALRLPAPSIEQILFWIVLLAIFLPSISARFRWKLTRTLLSLLLLFETAQLFNELRPPASRAVVLDVGQGDALFFETPGGKRYLIDAGTWSPGWNSGKGVILPFLRSEQIERIHGLFLTHPHADHIGGAAEILSAVRIDTVYRPAVRHDSELNREIQHIIMKERIPERTLEAGDLLNLGNELKIFVLNPEHPVDEKNVNNASLVMKWQFGETSWMLTGDAEHEVEERILNRFSGESRRFLKSMVLKVGHHGSRTSTTVEFLQAVAPRFAIVHVAFRNRYRHPHQEISERLHAEVQPEGKVYFTSVDGPILMRFDAQKIYGIQALKER